MTDFDLQMLATKFAEAFLPDDELRQQKANAAVVTQDGGVHSRALEKSLPWQRVDMHLAGVVVASSANARIAMPQGATIRHVATSARVAPTGIFRYSISMAGETEWFSLQPGVTHQMQGVNRSVPPGSWLVVSVADPAGAEDVLISIHYSAGGA